MRNLVIGSVVAAFISGMSLTASAQTDDTYFKDAELEALQILLSAVDTEDHAVVRGAVSEVIEECVLSRGKDPNRGLGFCSAAIKLSESLVLKYYEDNKDQILGMLHISYGISLYNNLFGVDIKKNPDQIGKEFVNANHAAVDRARRFIDTGLMLSPNDYTGLTFRSILSALIGDRGAQTAEDLYRACQLNGDYVNARYKKGELCAKLIHRHREFAMDIFNKH